MKTRKILLLLAVMLSMTLMTSCISSVQLSERALVQAIGLDRDDDGNMLLTLQIFSPAASAGGSLDTSSTNATIIEGKGATISQAVQNATATQGKQLFIGHSRLVIIGSELAKKDLKESLSFFSSNSSSRQNMNLVVADGKANDILKTKINQGILPAQTLEKILENAQDNSINKNVKVYEFLSAMEQKNSIAIPILSVEKQKKPPDSEDIEQVSDIRASGMAIFDKYTMTGKLDGQESRGMLWLNNNIKNATLIVETDKYKMAAINIYSSTTKVTPHLSAGEISFDYDISCKAKIGEMALNKGEEFDVKDIDSLNTAGDKLIEEECAKALHHSLIVTKADIFHFDDMVWTNDVKLWKSIKDDWENKLKDIKVNINAKLVIDKIGI